MRLLAATTLALLSLTAAPALADKGARANCMAHAESVALTGTKGGFQSRYNAAYNACIGGVSFRGYVDLNNRRTIRSPVAAACPPGAPKMYRGTLYCTH